MEDTFHAFEDHVIPYLEKYGGNLLFRVRPSKDMVVHTTVGQPYELHLVTFPDIEAFNGYRLDPERLKYLSLKDMSVEKMVLIEGKEV